MGFRVEGLGVRVFAIWGLELRVQGLSLRGPGFGFKRFVLAM